MALTSGIWLATPGYVSDSGALPGDLLNEVSAVKAENAACVMTPFSCCT
jgi:hypothetical protein